VLQCVAVCCSVLQRVARRLYVSKTHMSLQGAGVLQCVAVCCSVLQCVAACCSVLQRVAACCSVLQRVARSLYVCKPSKLQDERSSLVAMGWLGLVGSLKIRVSFAEYRALLQNAVCCIGLFCKRDVCF